MENTYLIEGVENQQIFEIPLIMTIKPKDNTVKLDMKEINLNIDEGIIIPAEGVTIGKSISKRNKKKRKKEKETNKYKIISFITGIILLVILVLYHLFFSSK